MVSPYVSCDPDDEYQDPLAQQILGGLYSNVLLAWNIFFPPILTNGQMEDRKNFNTRMFAQGYEGHEFNAILSDGAPRDLSWLVDFGLESQERGVGSYPLVGTDDDEVGKRLPEEERAREMNGIERADGLVWKGVFRPPRDLLRDLENRPGGNRLGKDGQDVGALRRGDAPIALGAAHDPTGFDQRQARRRDLLRGRQRDP